MGVKDLELLWAHGPAKGAPTYISASELLIPFNFFVKEYDIKTGLFSDHFQPGIRYGCLAANVHLGIVAVGEKRTNGDIYVMSYPKMSVVSVLKQKKNEEYSSLEFMGMEFLLSLQIKHRYELNLWKWKRAERLQCLSVPLLEAEVPSADFCRNSFFWHQVFLRSNVRILKVQIRNTDDKYCTEASSYCLTESDAGEIEFIRSEPDGPDKTSEVSRKFLNILCISWLSRNRILFSTPSGVIKVGLDGPEIKKIAGPMPNLTCMAYSGFGLFVGHKTGVLEIVNVDSNQWSVTKSVIIGQSIASLCPSPCFDVLTILTAKGYVYLQDLSTENFNPRPIYKTETPGEVGICFVGCDSRVCVMAKKNGWLYFFRVSDGAVLGTFHVDEDVTAICASPLCSCVAVGCSSGFIYIIDSTDAQHPKIVQCEKAYEIAVEFLKFDNFGQFLVAAAQNQGIKIWDGRPSSRFRYMGCKRYSRYVKDIAVFARDMKEETVMLVLSESGFGSDKEAGNLLIRMKLHRDFSLNPQNYQIDSLGTLGSDALNFEKKTLRNQASKMSIHSSLGAVFYISADSCIQSCPAWSNFLRSKQTDHLSVKGVSNLVISHDQEWLALADCFGSVALYSTSDFTQRAKTEQCSASESICKSYMNFSPCSSFLISGRENGTIICYRLVGDLKSPASAPKWLVHCYLLSEAENECLGWIQEEDVRCVPSDASAKSESGFSTADALLKFDMLLKVVTFEVDHLLEADNTLSIPSNFIVRDETLNEISKTIRRKFLLMKAFDDDKTLDAHVCNPKAVSSFDSVFVVEMYLQRMTCFYDRCLDDYLVSESREDKATNSMSFGTAVKMRSRQDRLAALHQLIDAIRKLMGAFNAAFETMYEEKHRVTDSLAESYFAAKRVTQNLPSKAERDFWGAIYVHEDYGRLLRSLEINLESCPSEIKPENPKSDEDIQKTKKAIEGYIESAKTVQEKFNSGIEALTLKKKFCSFNIYRYAVISNFILLFTLVEDEFEVYIDKTDFRTRTFQPLLKEVTAVVSSLLDIEKSIRRAHLSLQKVERNSSYKLKMKYNALSEEEKESKDTLRTDSAEEIWEFDKLFWELSVPIEISDLMKILRVIKKNNFSKENPKEGEHLLEKKHRVMKIRFVLCLLQVLLMEVNGAKQICFKIERELLDNDQKVGELVELVQKMKNKMVENFKSVLAVLFENEDLRIDEQEEEPLNNVPGWHDSAWKDVEEKFLRGQQIHKRLEVIENHLGGLKEQSEQLIPMFLDRAKELSRVIKNLEQQLEELKQKFTLMKSVVEELTDTRKKSIFKFLKSRIFLNDSDSEDKQKHIDA